MRFVILQSIELAGFKTPRSRRRINNHFNDGWREAPNLGNTRLKLIVQMRRQARPRTVAFVLLVRIQIGDLILEQRRNVWVSVTRRCHGLHDIAGVLRVVIAVISDETAVLGVRREEGARIGSGCGFK